MNSDLELRRDVDEELASEAAIDVSLVAVSVNRGIVTLTGQVSSLADKILAKRAAARIVAAKAVVDQMRVVLPHDRPSDEVIGNLCLQALNHNQSIPRGSVHLEVSDGRVSLNGELFTERQRRSAEAAVHYVNGIVSVDNKIVVRHTEADLRNAGVRAKSARGVAKKENQFATQ